MEYEFTLSFKLAASEADTDTLIERLGAAGFDDALVGIGQSGRIALNFTREAGSAQVAMVSALRDVRKAIPDARLVEAGPDLVGLTDIAELVGVTRQNMRKLSLAYPDSFPVPVHSGSVALWHLVHVLRWLSDRGGYEIEPPIMEVAGVAMQINLVKEAALIERRFRREVRDLVA
jgi:hypothetical protein